MSRGMCVVAGVSEVLCKYASESTGFANKQMRVAIILTETSNEVERFKMALYRK